MHTPVDSALLAAIEHGDDTVDDLLSKGANPDVSTSDHWPALFLAIDSGNLKAVRSLLCHGVSANAKMDEDPALLVATFRSAFPIVRLLVNSGAEVNAIGKAGDTPLKVAAGTGDVEIARLLLGSGADTEYAGGIDGATALGVAASNGHAGVVQLLLEQGANVEARDVDDQTARDRLLRQGPDDPETKQAVPGLLRDAAVSG